MVNWPDSSLEVEKMGWILSVISVIYVRHLWPLVNVYTDK